MIIGTTKFNDFSFEYVAPLYLLNVSDLSLVNIKDIYVLNELNLEQIENTLVSEIKLSQIQAKIFLHVVINGKMNTSKISNDLKISLKPAILHF